MLILRHRLLCIRRIIVLCALGVATSVAAKDQSSPMVHFDETAVAFDRPLPHGKPFTILVTVSANTASVKLAIWVQQDRSCKEGRVEARTYDGALLRTKKKGKTTKKTVTYVARVAPLRYATRYCVSVTRRQAWQPKLVDALLSVADAMPADLAQRGVPIDLANVRHWLEKSVPSIEQYRLDAGDHATLLSHWAAAILKEVTLPAAYGGAKALQQKRSVLLQSLRELHSIDLKSLGVRAFPQGTPSGVTLAASQVEAVRRWGQRFGARPLVALLRSGGPAAGTETLVRDARRGIHNLVTVYCPAPSKRPQAAVPVPAAVGAFCRGLALVLPRVEKVARDVAAARKLATSYQRATRSIMARLKEQIPAIRAAVERPVHVGAADAVEGGTKGGRLPYVSADIGAMVPLFIDRGGKVSDVGFAVYLGVCVYFSPVDKEVPLSVDGGLRRRISLVLGFTVNDLKDADKTVEGILFGKGVLVGAGFRVTDHLRLGLGAVLMRQKSRNPAVDAEPVKVAPYASLSVDFDLASSLKKTFTKESKVLP